jgi:protein-disulfide isomerase
MKPNLFLALTVCSLLATPLMGQDEDLRKEIAALKAGQEAMQRELALEKQIDELRQGQEAIRKQLEEIKTLLQQRPAAAAAARPAGPEVAGVVFDFGSNPTKGAATAPLTLLEFTDYQCPYCSRFTTQTLPQLASEYIDTGKVRLVLVDMPLESIHDKAFKAAEVSQCAADQGKFWEMHDRLFANQRALEPWTAHATELGLDIAAFEECVSSGKHAESVRADLALAQKAGASGTPSFVLAKTDPAVPNKVTGITFLRGAQAFNAFKTAIDGALAEKSPSPGPSGR